jgi:hypothetical protein
MTAAGEGGPVRLISDDPAFRTPGTEAAGAPCLDCGMPAPPPEQTCTKGRDHRVGLTAGCQGCGRLKEACAARPCVAARALAVSVIRSALLDLLASGEIGPGGQVPPVAMTAAACRAGIGAGAVRYALGRLVTAGALRLVPGTGYYLRSVTALAGNVKAGRWKDEKPEDLDRLRAAVRKWREANPDGLPDEMAAALASQFRPDWEPVLRAYLFRADLLDAHVTTGISIIAGKNQ